MACSCGGIYVSHGSVLVGRQVGNDDRFVSRECIESYLGDTLLVHASVESGPRDLSWVLALEEKRLALAILETEHLGVTTDVELAL